MEEAWKRLVDRTFSATDINVKIDGPEYGWLNVILSTRDGREFSFSLSYIYSSLENL